MGDIKRGVEWEVEVDRGKGVRGVFGEIVYFFMFFILVIVRGVRSSFLFIKVYFLRVLVRLYGVKGVEYKVVLVNYRLR